MSEETVFVSPFAIGQSSGTPVGWGSHTWLYFDLLYWFQDTWVTSVLTTATCHLAMAGGTADLGLKGDS